MKLKRRDFLRRAGMAGAVGTGLAGLGSRAGAAVLPQPAHPEAHGLVAPPAADLHESHDGMSVVGAVDHARNGFDPHAILTDFDGGRVSQDRTGATVREYDFAVENKDIEVAPGVFFPAWTYNGRVPGPTIRATEGDRVRIRFTNTSDRHHTIHFHGIHSAAMDGVPGAGEINPGEEFTYDFTAEPFGTHLYHCHSLPLKDHIHRGLYGAFIVDPRQPRPVANELVMVMNGFDTNFDGANEVYAANTVAFAYKDHPIRIRAGQLQRLHLINITEFDPLNSIHLHATFFDLYRSGTSLTPSEFVDIVALTQAERHMLEFTYHTPGTYMFHAHQTEFTDLGWMGHFEVT